MNKTGVLLEVVLEKDTEKDPFSIEQLWTSFHGLYLPWYKRFTKAQPYISFEIKSENDMSKKKKEITFNFWVPEDHKLFLKQKIMGIYPNAQITELKQDYIPEEDDRLRVIETAEIGLEHDSAFSLKTFKDYESSDPLTSITASLTELENREIAIVQVVARPHDPKWRKRAARILARFERTGRRPAKLPEWTNAFQSVLGFFFTMIDWFLHGLFGTSYDPKVDTKSTSLDRENQKEMLEKAIRYPYSFQIRVLVGSPFGSEEAKRRVLNIVSSFKELDGPNNSLKKEFLIYKERTYKRMKNRYLSNVNNDDILSTVELASFCHLPNKNNFTPGLKKIQSKQAENPVDISKENAFGVANFRGQKRLIGLDELARMRHIYVSGIVMPSK
jgi:hypothetical protein